MHDQRVERGAPLGGVDRGDRLAPGRIGGEAVDGFGRHGDRARVRDQLRGACDRGGRIREAFGVQGPIP